VYLYHENFLSICPNDFGLLFFDFAACRIRLLCVHDMTLELTAMFAVSLTMHARLNVWQCLSSSFFNFFAAIGAFPSFQDSPPDVCS
jgi:hypothetical protein